MGNYLERLAIYCDCLQVPWQINKKKQLKIEQSKQDLITQECNIPNESTKSNIFQDKNLSIQKQMQVSQKFQNISKNQYQIPSYNISYQDKEQQQDNRQLQVIDLQKIEPIILKQGHDKARKHKTFYSTFRDKNLMFKDQKDQQCGQTLSNIFQSQNLNYFLGRQDKVQFYEDEKFS